MTSPAANLALRIAQGARLHAPEAVLGAIAVSLIAAEPAFAYVDPSVMTYAIQALAGVVVALSAVAGVAFRKTRRKLFALLNIDENARKEVEPDVHRVVDGVAVLGEGEALSPAADEGAAAPSPKRARSGAAPSRWPARFALALVAAAFTCFTLFVVAPFEIVAMSSNSLVLSLEDVAAPVALAACALALVAAVAVSLLRGRAFTVAVALVVAVGVASWAQAMFLNGGLPLADGAEVVWDDYTTITVISAAVWVAILAAAVAASVLFSRATQVAAAIVSVALIIVQGVGVGSLVLDPERVSAKQILPENVVCTEEGLFELSDKHNVVMFVLDTFDTRFLDAAFADDPSLVDIFDGFTYYHNATGTMIPTRYGVPYLITGEYPRADETYDDFLENRYLRSDFLSVIHDAGYSIGLYTDSLEMADYPESMKKVSPLTMNLHPVANDQIDPVGTVRILAKCALYRDMPWVLKPALWFYTDEVNNAMVRDDSASATVYSMDDIGYYETLREEGLALSDDAQAGSFRMIHLLGYHYPFIMNEYGEYEEGVRPLEQSEGALRIVGEYLDQMKELGVFDDATIIVTADHGEWYLTDTFIDRPTSPMILYKPAMEQGSAAASEPLRTTNDPVSQMDLPPTVIDEIGGDASAFGEGATIDSYEGADPDRRRLYCMTRSNFTDDTALVEYEIEGDVFDFSNWRLTGTEWACF